MNELYGQPIYAIHQNRIVLIEYSGLHMCTDKRVEEPIVCFELPSSPFTELRLHNPKNHKENGEVPFDGQDLTGYRPIF